MGVVRREGEWRLEKVDEGHYELTHRRDIQAKILTPSYDPGVMGGVGFGLHDVFEVDSYVEVEGIFEEHAQRNSSGGSNTIRGASTAKSTEGSGDSNLRAENGKRSRRSNAGDVIFEDVEDLPPGGFALILVLAGAMFIWIYGIAPRELPFQFAALTTVTGVLIFGWAAVLFRRQGWDAAFDFLVKPDDDNQENDSEAQAEGTSKNTDPIPKKRRRELIFGRANQRCEWCEADLDNPQVHHIEARREGGSNEPRNLLVLCPTCHSKADKGGISKSMLREKLRHIQNQ